MAVWRIINRSYLKYASSRFTRSYSQTSLLTSVNYGAKQSKICSSYHPNSDISRKPHSVFGNVRFLGSSILEKIKKEDVETDGPSLNEQITAQFVRLVTEDGHFVIPRSEALRRAKEQELDLVEVQKDAKPPVCKIMDYTREKYLRDTQEKERAKAKRSEGTLRSGVKEVIFNPKIETKDLKFKADQAMKMMERGYRVKCSAKPEKNKEIGPEELTELLSRFIPFIEDSVVESGPHLEKGQAFVVVRHAKYGGFKKGGCKKMKDVDIKAALQAPSPRIDPAKVARRETKEKETKGADVEQSFDFSEDSVKPELNSSSRRGETKPGLNVNQNQPVEGQNRYARKEPPSDQANRYASRPPANPQHAQPRFPSQHPTGFQTQNPQHSQPRFPNQDPNHYPAGFQPWSPNQNQNRQPSQPQFPNRYPNQHPNGFQPPRSPPQPRGSNQGPNQQPTGPGGSSGPGSGYGVFSNPNNRDR